MIGRTIDVDGRARLVVGVVPGGFRLPTDFAAATPTELFVPLAADPVDHEAIPGPAFAPRGGAHGLLAVARLRPGASLERASAELAALIARTSADGVYPPDWDFRATLVPVGDEVTGALRPALLSLLVASLLILLVACADVAAVLLVRGERRRSEVGIRAAMGAGTARLFLPLLLETALLGLAAAAVGSGLAFAGMRLVRRLAPPTLPRLAEATVHPAALLLAIAAGIATALVFGLLSGAQARRVDPATLLRERGGRSGNRAAASPARRAALVAQVTLTVVALSGAGLMLRTLVGLLALDPGFRSDGVVTADLSVPSALYPGSADVRLFYGELLRQVSALPGVKSAAIVRQLPLTGNLGDRGLRVDGYAAAAGERVAADWQVVSPGYFATLGIPLRAGRLPAASDEGGAPIAVVNESLARRYFAGRDAVGGRIFTAGTWYTVIGVVAGTHTTSLVDELRPCFFALHGSPGFGQRSMSLVVRGALPTRQIGAMVSRELRRLDRRVATSPARPLADVVAGATAAARFTAAVLAVFAALALTLAAIGCYGLVAEVAEQRSRELGIRVAVGAGAWEIARLVVGEAVLLTAAGGALGLAASLLAARGLASQLYGTSTGDPAVHAVALGAVLASAVLASVPVVVRALRVAPARLFRQE